MKKVELLAPCGSKEAFYSAINAGCDALYLGGMKFGARSYANNFSLEDLEEMLSYARLYNVKIYCTVNTVIFEDEFDEVIEFIGNIHKLGIDGVLIQDYGLLSVLHKIYPNLTIHASTQMNVTTLEEVRHLMEFGVSRVVLARETPIDEIKRIKENLDIEIEVFVHGAICISYSGNCYMSSIITKRSGNRGKCAGSCRLEYKLIGDNGYNEKFNYPLSSKDLMTLSSVDELIKVGVDSLKIEGRMKRPEYVGQVVSSYRKAIDKYYNNSSFDLTLEVKKLKYIFNRGFTKGFLFKEKNSQIINSAQPNHIGVEVGKVIKVYSNNTVDIKLTDEVRFNDSLRLVAKSIDAITINQMKVGNTLKKEAFKNQIINVKVHNYRGLENALVYKTTDSNQLNEIGKLSAPEVLIDGKVSLDGDELILSVTDGTYSITDKVLIDGLSTGTFNSRILSQISKSGSVFKFRKLENLLDKEVFIQISKVNNLRRNVLNKLMEERKKCRVSYQKNDLSFHQTSFIQSPVELTCRVRTSEQLTEVINAGIKKVYITDYKLYQASKDNYPELQVYYCEPRIGNNCKVNKKMTSVVSAYNKSNVSSIYANCCNSYTLKEMADNLSCVGISLEVDRKRMKMMLEHYKKRYGSLPNIEVMVYGRYELMVMKYCPINDKVITDKNTKDKLFCNECIKHNYKLVDKGGYDFLLIRDELCNLRVLNSKVTNLINYLDELISYGVNNLLLDFIKESPSECREVIKNFKEALQNKKKSFSQEYLSNYTSGHFSEGVL